jgi:hypothetical protein
MGYSEILHRRIPYDINGTVVGHRASNTYANGLSSWLTSSQTGELNDEDTTTMLSGDYSALWFFFPERMEIEAGMYAVEYAGYGTSPDLYELQGSNDTTNGMDGTWETAVFPSGKPFVSNPGIYYWREVIKPISFSTTYKVIRFRAGHGYGGVRFVHLYGRKAAGETPTDILFCDTAGNEKTALKDWGDRPEGTTVIDTFKLKNSSLIKVASNVNLQLNHADLSLSFYEEGPWTATLDITSIAPGSLSSTIYVRHTLGEPLLILGPRAGRCIVTVGSWL